MNPLERILEKQKVLIIDGAFGTELERKGYDINDSLWSAKFLMEKPEAIAAVHLDYLNAGSDCITTASYQASFEGFMKRGMSEQEAKALIQSSITIAQSVRDTFWENEQNHLKRHKPLVAASVGPYGAYLADGSEFRGNYGLNAEALIDEIKAVSTKPIIVYPNGGSTYNALTKTWDGLSKSSSHGKMAYAWYQKGARIIGGCCQTTPEDIAQIAQWVRA